MRSLVFVILATTVVAAQFPPPALSDQTTPVSAHVHVVRGFPNIGIVLGDQATLVVDTGLGPSNGAVVARAAARLSKGRTLYLTTTHFHPEHAGGEGGFPAGTILIRSKVQQEELVEQGAAMLTVFRRLSPEYATLLNGVTELRRPDQTFDTEKAVDLGGGVTARVMWLGPAHTKGDQVVFVEPDRTLITGDIVQNKVVPAVAGQGGSFSSWLTVLDKLDALKALHVVPDHSAPGDGALVGEERAFLSDMRSRARTLKQQGLSAAAAADQLKEVLRSVYPQWAANTDWPNVNSVNGFVQSVYAEADAK